MSTTENDVYIQINYLSYSTFTSCFKLPSDTSAMFTTVQYVDLNFASASESPVHRSRDSARRRKFQNFAHRPIHDA